MREVKISSKNQIVIPREARQALGVRAGDKLLVVVRGTTVILLPKPRKYAAALKGSAPGLYPPDYLEGERESWR